MFRLSEDFERIRWLTETLQDAVLFLENENGRSCYLSGSLLILNNFQITFAKDLEKLLEEIKNNSIKPVLQRKPIP